MPTLYSSPDGGGRFGERRLTPAPPFRRTIPLYVDPRDPKIVYLVNQGDPTQALLRVDGDSGQQKELLRLEGAIYGVTLDAGRGRLFVATSDGLYYGDSEGGAGPLSKSAGLSRAQCASVRGDRTYACSWNYYPDMAAVARSDDGGQSFRRVFQYADTQGVLSCPATTGVARICPAIWDTYASLLGIDTGLADMGGGKEEPQPGCSCAVAPGVARGNASGALALLSLIVLLRGWLSRGHRLT